ncbi:ROK family protein [Sulfobacillus acidophilus TPY]|uniref:Glucokinase n=1 Tax=Sulfobacillus acidophilus (strain ATCC 700253 / DSM 10332 / NAL) TaxID=679936 RepID=G8TSK2_SULAD|nr:ROK family protein [Sulfobacillus acidophilus TPY]AEW06694.1 Glucokinase [Sulfobacillus acidophilus DSM 10332]
MYTSVDASLMRTFNKRTVLRYIYQHDQTSRVAISQATGLNRATVSSVVDELIAQEWVREIGPGDSRGGRRPILLRFNERAGYAIGIDVQISHLYTVMTDATRRVIYEHRADLDPTLQPMRESVLLERLVDAVDRARQALPESPYGIFGVGIALPGLVNYQTGQVVYLPNLDIHDWPIVQALKQVRPYPVVIDNDANCGAWSEYLAQSIPNMLFINAGIGVGAGIIVDGQLYRGHHGIAGEAGHTTISTVGLLCSCGNYGCWEQYASEQALARYVREQGEGQADPFMPDFVKHALGEANRGNPIYQAAWRTLGEYLGIGMANLANLFNPERIFLGGTIAQAREWILPEISRVMRHRAMDRNKSMTVEVSHHRAVAMGAAGLAIANAIDLLPTRIH